MRQFGAQIVISLCFCGAGGLLYSQQPSSALRQADADYRAGVLAMNRGDLKTAEQRFEAVVRLEPGIEQGHSALGAVLLREGQWQTGIRELEKALAIKPGDESAQLNLAMSYAETNSHAKAVPLFAKAEAAASTRGAKLPAQVLTLYADSLAAIGHTDAAIVQMRKAAAQSGSGQIYDALGSLYAQKRDWPQAEAEFERALQLEPKMAMAHMHLGYVFQAEQKGDPVSEWLRAYALAPANGQVAVLVGKALTDAGHDKKAIPILEEALRLEPRSMTAAYELGVVYQRNNRVADAAELFQKVVQADAKNVPALVNLGLALGQLHRGQDGIPYLQRAVTLAPTDLTAHQNLAAAYLQVDQVASGIKELKKAIALAPNLPKTHYDLGVAYKLQDDAVDAIPQLEMAEKLDPSGYEAPYVLGLLYDQVARYPEAAQQLERSLKLHGLNGDGWSTLGSVYLKMGKLPEAATALRNAIQQLPSHSDPHLLLANVLIKQGNVAEAARERKIAAQLMRAHMNRQRAEVATNSGKALLDSGKVDAAVVEFQNALTFDPTYAEAHMEFAQALDRQGKAQQAAAERAKAKSLASEENAPSVTR